MFRCKFFYSWMSNCGNCFLSRPTECGRDLAVPFPAAAGAHYSKTNGPIFKIFVLNESWWQAGPLTPKFWRSRSFKAINSLSLNKTLTFSDFIFQPWTDFQNFCFKWTGDKPDLWPQNFEGQGHLRLKITLT